MRHAGHDAFPPYEHRQHAAKDNEASHANWINLTQGRVGRHERRSVFRKLTFLRDSRDSAVNDAQFGTLAVRGGAQ